MPQSYRGQLDLKCTVVKGREGGGGKADPSHIHTKQSYENKAALERKQLREPQCLSSFSLVSWMFLVFAPANASDLNGGAWPPGCQEFYTCTLAQTLHCLEMPLACLAPEGLSSHVGTIHYSYSSPLLLLQSFILYCLPGKQTPKQSCLSKTQPGSSPTFSPFSEYTVVARRYLCIVSLKPSKPKLWFSC